MKEEYVDPCSFTQKGNGVSHQNITNGESLFSCTQCAKSFNRKAYLTNHQKTHWGVRPFSCPTCEKSFTRKEHLVLHQRIHTEDGAFSVTKCESNFGVKENSIKQEIIHTVERPFSCMECGKGFNLKDRLQRHHKTHTGERPFFCSQCEKSFHRKDHLERHLKTHTNTPNLERQTPRERTFFCTQCEKSFTRKETLQRHQRIHTGERPFCCSQCEQSFNRKEHLQRHQRTHIEYMQKLNPTLETLTSSEKCLKTLTQGRFSCTQCDKSFSVKSSLQRHQTVHTRPYSCTECEKRFSQKVHLVKHQRTHTWDHQLGDIKLEKEQSCLGSLLGKPASATQDEIDSEKDFKPLKIERGTVSSIKQEGHSLWDSIYAEIQAEHNLSKHKEEYVLDPPTVSSRTAVLKAATFTFKSPVTVPPPTAPLPTMLMEETAKTPFPAPALSSGLNYQWL